jgi:hypothetical protein
MTDSVTYNSIVTDPHWRLCALKPMESQLVFHYLEKSDIERENYIDHGYLNQKPGRYVSLPMEALFELTENKPLPLTHYIFHTAFCGSTLLARCMDLEAKSFSVREPNALMQLAEFKREQGSAIYQMEVWPRLLRLVVFLLGRPFAPDASVIIKPSNSMNNLIVDLMRLDSRSKALMMSSESQEFIVSNLKKEGYQQFCQQIIALLAKDKLNFSFNKSANLEELSGPQLASLVWALQQIQWNGSTSELQTSRFRYLNVSEFLQDPSTTIAALSEFFQLHFESSEVNDIISSQAFTSHSKEDRGNYSNQAKQQEDQKIALQHKDDIQSAESWLADLALDIDNSSRIRLLD